MDMPRDTTRLRQSPRGLLLAGLVLSVIAILGGLLALESGMIMYVIFGSVMFACAGFTGGAFLIAWVRVRSRRQFR
jgi:ABC-type transport system involved in multi-copper enzyme maturation permease subunit